MCKIFFASKIKIKEKLSIILIIRLFKNCYELFDMLVFTYKGI